MNKAKLIFVAVGVLLAMAFTVSCSDDDKGPELVGACRYPAPNIPGIVYDASEYCAEYYNYSDNQWANAKQGCFELDGTVLDKCPSKFDCSDVRTGASSFGGAVDGRCKTIQ
ncbi:MAG: hypothetical protein FWC26_11440 [Fibromonadales bacterium]|nr:hypothetical protein [Fibromonadales bacterium]